jgi:hypothetical protein
MPAQMKMESRRRQRREALMANNAALASGTSDINISCVSEVLQGVIATIGLVSSMFSHSPAFLLHHDQVHQIEESFIIVL